MAMSKEAQVASLYNLKSVVDGMVSMVKGGVLTFDKALEGIGTVCMDLSERNAKPDKEG